MNANGTLTNPFDFSWMVGRNGTVTFSEPSFWSFDFGDSLGIRAECPWRLLERGSITVSGLDHGHQYGLPAPIDAATRATSLLAGLAVRRVQIGKGTADVIIDFEGDLRLEITPFSSGYESWQASVPGGKSVVAQGGGQLSVW